MSQIGHNSIAGKELKKLIERAEKLMHDRAVVNADIRDVFAEAKGMGFDVRTMREAIKHRAMDAGIRAERESLRDLYFHALGLDLV